MTLWRLAHRSLTFYWRTNLGVFLTVVASTAILTGALVVGDSVRYSLRRMVISRLGTTQFALISQDRFFRAQLAEELAEALKTPTAPLLQVRGVVSDGDDTRRANSIEVLGVDERFFNIGGGQNPFGDDREEGVVLNEPLARRLNVGAGDEVVLRIEKPSLMSRDLPLTPDSDLSMSFRLTVKAIATEAEFGRFSLQANQAASLNVFVSLEWIQNKLEQEGRANMLLIAEPPDTSLTLAKANESLKKHWQLSDASLDVRRLDQRNAIEIRSRRVFIDESLADAAIESGESAVGVLTYFVNELRGGGKATPYSMVTAMGASDIVSPDMKDDEILINQWLADDLSAKVGETIELRYYVLTSMRKLQEQTTSFRIRAILPMEEPAVDPELMPNFPGLSGVDNCRDWDAGIPVDLDKIRQKDEDYWDTYKGTPKAFVTLKAGKAMWANRYGNLTAVRYPLGLGSMDNELPILRLSRTIDPATVGLFFQPVRERGMKAGAGSTDFGSLFLGLSIFLVIAALILTSLIFVFGVEKRSGQIGMLLALGFAPKQVRRLLFLESGMLALLGAVVGSVTALLYTRMMIYGLATIWQTAVAGSIIHFYTKTSTLFVGAFSAIFVSLFAIWLTLRKQVSRPARELLAGNVQWQFVTTKHLTKGKISLWIAALATLSAILFLVLLGSGDSSSAAGAFFGAGALLLIAGLSLTGALLRMLGAVWNKTMTSLAGLGLRNSTRRTERSLAVVGLLACGIFLVIAVGANKHSPVADARKRDSGTGGFTLYGESAIGVLYDLNSAAGREAMNVDDKNLEGIEIVQLRVRDGDDASCYNLNRAQRPRLLGVQPDWLQTRGSFTFAKVIEDAERREAWNLLNLDLGDDVVPAIGDYATVIWALGKTVGDELEYSDEKGRTFRLRIVGMIQNSILQGSLLVAEDEFVERFPSEDGYRMLLIDSPEEKADRVTDTLSYELRDFGLALTPTTQRLAEFSAVENTYLSIFLLLGGLGLVLGSVGLGLVVLRNVLDRRGELAMLWAVGFDKVALRKMIFHEHSSLMLFGLVCGVVAALVAVGPALSAPGADVGYLSLILTVAGIGISGMIWIWLAAAFALSGRMLEALRNE
ncbi:MAG: FtsX-like permease family protein [Sedimentisphaerales bacterium]|nr:FtsX-like permease family protein [Sedimentisphaerales bacterium]